MTTISDGMRRATAEPLESIRRRAEQEQVLFNPKDVLAILDRIAELEGQVAGWHAAIDQAVATASRDNACAHGIYGPVCPECPRGETA